MALDYQESDPIILGSGELYLGTVANPETALETAIEAALKNVGAIESGATLEYKNSIQEIQSANRGTVMRFITKEEVTFDCGVLTWLVDNLALLAPATVTTDGTSGTKTVRIGGKGLLPTNYLRFIHTKKDGSGTITVNIMKAQNTNGFKLTFDSEKPSSIGYQFSALATNDGTLVEIIETFTEV
ncbi:hypothetical protein [Desulfosporosinus youngiae]|uniref:Uncharacterized protein n=1 Tax=Desulfosporosinus youngiae DSM 17734 TaxID=768710 RepID=H5Y564_9FIRM|nr:hypothetical protein [Desulfosporosinus youngiae]EHQ90168.1 hypothetical protein DesyoDRAFT_3134 [Desulfosporosinus youngiae DSM 17734]